MTAYKTLSPFLRLLKEKYKFMKIKSTSEIVKDNFHFLHGVYTGLVNSFPGNKKMLCENGEFPRIYEYAQSFCRITQNRLQKESLNEFLDGVSKNIELQNDEVGLFIDMFSAVLFINISDLCCNKKREVQILNAVKSLRFLKDYAYEDMYEKLSACEKLLLKDKYYKILDKDSKNLYRHRVALLAKKENISESEFLRKIFDAADSAEKIKEKHIGYWLFERKISCAYMPLTIMLPIVVSVFIGIFSHNAWIAILSFLPIWEILKICIDFLYSKTVSTQILPRINTEELCPKTLVASITLISDRKSVDKALENVERCYFSNKANGVYFGILADLAQSRFAITDKDADAIAYVKKKLFILNEKHDNAFFAAIRIRTKNNENKYEGRERKRGAVEDFLNATRGQGAKNFLLLEGDIENAKYFTALDSDTVPTVDSISKLVGVLEHPLHTPVLNQNSSAVEDGYGIAVPRIEVSLKSANENLFSRIISGFGGVELYGNASFSVYQDLYGEGIFAGKGVINIDLFLKILSNVFCDNRILSHDILEGSFLRVAYVSDVTFNDNTPKNVLSYAGRNHRWIRGDIQNAVYLKHKIQTKFGEKENPFNSISKYKIFDNIRRVFTIPLTFLLIMSSLFFGITPLIIGIVSLFCSSILTILTTNPVKQIKYRTKAFPQIFQIFTQPLFNLFVLPYFAYCQTEAAIKAFYRLKTKKKLLEWTTASDADKKIKGTLKEYLLKMFPQYIGIFFLLKPVYLPLTIIWISAIFIAYYSAKENKKEVEKIDLSKYAYDMWGYISTFQNEENNYLPPDNFQQMPLGVVARRTSPTNIGLSMLCALGAYDLEIICEEELCSFLEKVIESIERLEKHEGHLFNWYSTQTLKPLYPKYISSVDNGNFIAFIYALKNGLTEFQGRRIENLITRLAAIIETTDFSFLYDSKKNLFHIGYDVEKNEYSNSFYDLYASESRLLSYYSIAKRQVPLKNWQSISRFMIKRKGYLGVKSWTGTMFEYFMPNILLPVYQGSLCDEALCFAFDAQKREEKNKVWGISESGFYAFDKGLSYQYKAFGVPTLALKKFSVKPAVVSPYSTWLAFPYFPQEAMNNLKRLENMGMYGKYGFYEAIDFSAKDGAIVYSYMVHHIGMSFLSIVNYHKDNIMQKRFMNSRMKAFSGLLEEKLPTFAVNYKDEPEGRHRQERYFSRSDEYTQINPEYPNVKALTNKNLSSLFSDSGTSKIIYDGKAVTRSRDIDDPKGVFFIFSTADKRLPLTYAPLYDNSVSYKVYFDEGEVSYFSRRKDIEGRLSSGIDFYDNIQAFEFVIKNNVNKPCTGQMLIYFEPVLNYNISEKAHPAFSNLFLESFYESNILYYRRRVRDNENEEMWLGVYIDESYEFELSRFNVLNRLDGLKSLSSAFEKKFTNDASGAVDPCVAMKFNVTIPAKSLFEKTFYLAVGKSKDEVLNVLTGKKEYSVMKKDFSAGLLSLYEKNNIKKECVYLFDLINSAIYKEKNNNYRPKEYRNHQGIEGLWKYGISGDFPIILIKVDETFPEKAESFVKAFWLMKLYNIDCEAVLCFSEGASYDRPIYSKLKEYILNNGLEQRLERRNGIFLVNVQSVEDFALLASTSLFYADLSKGWKVKHSRQKNIFSDIITSTSVPIKYLYKTGLGGFTERGFGLDDKDALISRPPWTFILANQYFGTVISDSTLGYTYAINSQQNMLTPWKNDVISDNNAENLFYITGGITYNLIRGSSVIFEKGKGIYKCVCGNVNFTITVFVPNKFYAKIIIVDVENRGESDGYISYEPQIIMGKNSNLSTVNKTIDSNAIYYKNPLNTKYSQGVTALFGEYVRVNTKGLIHYTNSGKTSKAYFILGYGGSEKRARSLVKLLGNEARILHEYEKSENKFNTENSIEIKTEIATLDLLYNTFLPYQIKYTRLFGRTAFYQCSGAYGFRDQLQDAAAIGTIEPWLLRRQIIRSSKHQFEQGDVMHWWHCGLKEKNLSEGVRTRSSDDLLWLVFAVCEYLKKTKDYELLNVITPYLTSEELSSEEDERYITAYSGNIKENIYNHCKRALNRGIRLGQNQLVLFGSGDWNDGMNKVGTLKDGESVFSSLFSIMLLESFAEVSDFVNDYDYSKTCIEIAKKIRKAIEEKCWDGDRYIRGYYDNGKAMGAKESIGCQIDLLPTAFTSIVGGFDKMRVADSYNTVEKHLIDKENKIVKLFSPPFIGFEENVGYIQGYINGVRENGGQYTHAAVWLALGYMKSGRYDKGFYILDILNPINHSKTFEDVKKYRVEPYVLSADVYSNPAHVGMGGWTHYTGGAGWYYKVVTEELLGILRSGDKLYIKPKLPEKFTGYNADIRIDGTRIKLSVIKGIYNDLIVNGKQMEHVPLDGRTLTVICTVKI